MKTKHIYVLVCAIGFFAPSGFVRAANVTDCKISFKTKGEPVLISIEGKSDSPCSGVWLVEGGNTKKSKITMELNKLDTGISLRNKHLRENYLHTDKFPIATITEIDAKGIDSAVKGGGKQSFTGQLELHGQKAPVQGTYEVKGSKEYSGEFEIDLPDFGVERPSFMGVKVVDKVRLTFQFKAE